jgi:hypothetical protein
MLDESIDVRALRALREYLAARFGDEQRVFELHGRASVQVRHRNRARATYTYATYLCAALAVHGGAGPVVGPQHFFPRALRE